MTDNSWTDMQKYVITTTNTNVTGEVDSTTTANSTIPATINYEIVLDFDGHSITFDSLLPKSKRKKKMTPEQEAKLEKINIDQLIPMHEKLRSRAQISSMVNYAGHYRGFFTMDVLEANRKPSYLITLCKMEDGSFYIRDGHHRVYAILVSGRSYIRSDEYVIEERTYEDFQQICFLRPDGAWMGWITPHDIKTEVRVPELSRFKTKVKKIYDEQGENAALEFIKSHRSMYAKPRKITSISQIV